MAPAMMRPVETARVTGVEPANCMAEYCFPLLYPAMLTSYIGLMLKPNAVFTENPGE